jgi:hypothetical protein
VVLFGPTDLISMVGANVVLKALSTREDGSAVASSAACELWAGTTRESNVSRLSGYGVGS